MNLLVTFALVLGAAVGSEIIKLPVGRIDDGIVATVRLGSPEQNFSVLLDTSDTTFWVYSKKCSKLSLACWSHAKFDGEKSKTFKSQNIKVKLPDSSEGLLSADIVKFGSTGVGRHVFVELTKTSGIAKGFRSDFDGVFGLGLPYDHADKLPPPPFFKILSSYKEQVMTLYFGKDKSEVGFGGIDYNLVKPETISFAPITIQDCWTINIDSITVGDKDICSGGCQARLDTSSDGIMGPDDQVTAVREVTRHAKTDGYFSCSKLKQLPPLKFTIGGKVFVLNAEDYAVKHSMVFGLCSDGLTDLGNMERYWILGNNFITKFYTILDYSNKQVGFGHHKNN